MKFSKLMHSIIIVICVTGPTASIPWYDAIDLYQF